MGTIYRCPWGFPFYSASWSMGYWRSAIRARGRIAGAGRCLQCCSILSVPFRSVCCDMRSRGVPCRNSVERCGIRHLVYARAYARRTFWHAEGRKPSIPHVVYATACTIRCIRHRDVCRTALLRENSANSMIRGCSPAFCGGDCCNSVPLRIISQRKRWNSAVVEFAPGNRYRENTAGFVYPR